MVHSASLRPHRAAEPPVLASAATMAPSVPNKPDGEGGWTFRAPRTGDLVACPYCDPDAFRRCDHCGDEGVLFTSEVFQ